jgi:hypothetical protein
VSNKSAAATGRGGGADELKPSIAEGFKPGAMLEGVLQRELSGAIITDSAGDLPKIAVSHSAVWRSIIGDVESIEEIGPEFHPMLMPEREALEDGHVDVLKARSTERTRLNCAERVVRLLGKDAIAIILIGAA